MKATDGIAELRALALVILAGTISFTVVASAIGAESGKQTALTTKRQIPERKQTTLGLYVTAKEAYGKWKEAPNQVKIIDVRTPEEYAFIGHPEAVWNIPFAFVTYQRINGQTEHGVKMNEDFITDVKKIAQPSDMLFVMCRSGDRSAKAVNQLAKSGFTNAYSITDGMEGDKVSDPESVFQGKRMQNGWKNAGMPWVYSIDTDRILIPEGTIKQTP